MTHYVSDDIQLFQKCGVYHTHYIFEIVFQMCDMYHYIFEIVNHGKC